MEPTSILRGRRVSEWLLLIQRVPNRIKPVPSGEPLLRDRHKTGQSDLFGERFYSERRPECVRTKLILWCAEIQMKRMKVVVVGAVFVTFCALLGAAPADARTMCRGSGIHVKCSKIANIKKKNTRSRHAYRAGRLARVESSFPWHGWSGSFHLNGTRYPGGNPSGPAYFYNNYEGGFHPTAFWELTGRVHY